MLTGKDLFNNHYRNCVHPSNNFSQNKKFHLFPHNPLQPKLQISVLHI